MQASLDYAQSLLHAKDLTEMMRLHTEYVQAQMRSLAEQASEMGQIVGRAAMDAAKPKTKLDGRTPRPGSFAIVPGTSNLWRLPCGIAPKFALHCTKLT